MDNLVWVMMEFVRKGVVVKEVIRYGKRLKRRQDPRVIFHFSDEFTN
jgi:plasmid rolling circle replication initiator protein Rep